MKQDNRLQFIHIRQINQTNVNDIYQKQFNRFIFDYSDEVNIDGKIYSNTGYDKMMKINLVYLKNEKGEPNFKKIYANGIKDGFKLTENDFVEYELEQIVDYTPKGLTEKKQLKTYKEYLEKRLSELNKSSETTHHFDSNQPLKNYELFYNRYKKFFFCIVNNDLREFYNTCNDLSKLDMLGLSSVAVDEVKYLLKTPNNNAETLKKSLQRETTELMELSKQVYETHKINNVQTKDFNNLLAAFKHSTISLNEFLDAILPLIENDSNNTNKLSEAEQKEVLNIIQVDFIEFFREAKLTKEEQINFIENQIKGMYLNFPETPRTDFFIERLKRLKEAISKPQQETKTDAPPPKKENLYNEYFRGNTFILFKAYCDEYNIDNTCRTDLSVLFQLFTKHEYFVDTMELKHYLKFLNKYLKYDSAELRKVELYTNKNIVRTNNFNRIKNNLELTLK